MEATLPDGWTWRRPTTSDADVATVFALIARHNLEVIGEADFTLADTAEQLNEPGFDPRTDAWLVLDPAGVAVGFGCIREGVVDEDRFEVPIEAVADEEHVARWLFATIMVDADQRARAAGRPGATVDTGVYRQDGQQRALAAELGFTPTTVFHRMRIDHSGDVRTPELPATTKFRSGPGDEAFRRDAHSVLQESFALHFGWVPQTFDEWCGQIEASPTTDWEQLYVIDVDGEPVAMLHAGDAFVEDLDCGFVRHVGVRPDWRGRGLGRLLLLQTFAADAAAGRTGTVLHVDTNNVTPALDLYEGVGMRPVLVIDVWRRPAPGWSAARSLGP